MYARAVTLDLNIEMWDELGEFGASIKDRISGFPGLISWVLVANRETGKGTSFSLFEDEQAFLAVNDKINAIFDGVRNYIFMHYKLNSRDDTEYWRANRENANVPADVARILAVWDKGGDLLAELRAQASRLVYSPTSWYCILAGMGRFPRSPKKPKKKLQVVDPREAQAYCEGMLAHFPDHRAALSGLGAAA